MAPISDDMFLSAFPALAILEDREKKKLLDGMSYLQDWYNLLDEDKRHKPILVSSDASWTPKEILKEAERRVKNNDFGRDDIIDKILEAASTGKYPGSI